MGVDVQSDVVESEAGDVLTGRPAVLARRGAAGRRFAVASLALATAVAAVADAEPLGDRVEVHGHAESQVRAISEKFEQELDLAQWYNVLNLELEADLLPSGARGIDLLSAYVRVEGRYDAIYSEGFGLFHSIDTYGNGARRLPKRLRDAEDADYAGVTPTGEPPLRRHASREPAPFVPEGERRGIPDYDIFFRQAGADNVHGTADDPGRYANAAILDHRFALKDFRGGGTAPTQVLGPWLPKNEIVAVALGVDRANPFRGRIAATATASGFDGTSGGAFDDPTSVRFFSGDPQLVGYTAAQIARFQVDRIDITSSIGLALFSPDTVITELSRGKCERAGMASCVVGQTFPDPDGGGMYTVRALNEFGNAPLVGAGDFSIAGYDGLGNPIAAFGGDFSGIIPCLDPTEPDLSSAQREARIESDGCIPGSFQTRTVGGVTTFERRVTSAQNVRYTGGSGEAPFRPAPDLAITERSNPGNLRAQGLYIPSVGLRRTLASGDLDPLDFDFSESERAFNRGASQQRTKELKEAYLDLETLDRRLWMRLGLQHIVWGKTEIFRTTDQFNPQDLALSSLPSLEESRIALWSARFVYSLYDVGPLEDVRLELAMNLDEFVPNDLGACGEPYTADFVCTITNGLSSHSYLGAGIAGIDRPESPWDDPSALEIGGRIEWRWDRFSFALTDFYGYSDVPYADAIFYYDRSVDVRTGRPVVAGLPGQTLGRCATGGQIAPDPVNRADPSQPGIAYSTSFASHPFSVTASQRPYAQGPGGVDLLPDGRPLDGTTEIRGGVGGDPDCLRPGGAPGFANAFTLDPDSVLARTNALEFHSSNQQLFAWSCISTVGIAAALEPGACAWTFFTSPNTLRSAALPVAEAFGSVFAGNPDGPTSVQYMALVHDFQKNAAVAGPLIAFPLASLNRVFNDPQAPIDRNGNGVADNGAGCADADPATPCDLGGFDGFDTRTRRADSPGAPTLDNSLTNEQRALLGCGPFYGTRCDTSARETDTLHFPQSGAFGGIDFLNMEASVLVQSWLGLEGTVPGQTLTDNRPQPGTVGPLGASVSTGATASARANVPFLGGPVCTRFVESEGVLKLPGCRGVASLTVEYADPNGIPGDADDEPTAVRVAFENGYLPSVDGCILGDMVRRQNGAVVPVTAIGASPELRRELAACSNASSRRAVPERLITGFDAQQNPITAPNPDCAPRGFGGTLTINGAPRRVFICASEEVTLAELPLIHPTAGCVASPTNPRGVTGCFEWANRDLVEEFFDGSAQLFQNELAAFSYNFLMFLAITSCDTRSVDLDGADHQGGRDAFRDDPECFLPTAPYRPDRCSLATPQLCANVKSFLAAVGVSRNTVRAAGNERFGRRTFIWHSGGEVVLRYDQRNVLGFATDFAEDYSKTSWGIEFTWIEDVPFEDADDPEGITDADQYNLTVSIDRPTFIHFLNPNRTFLFNTQWFVSYVPRAKDSFATNGPVNAFFTFSVSTGYYQDRMIPELLTVYEFDSKSGGIMPSLQYRMTDNLSVTVGVLWFFGRTQLNDIPVREVSPVVNRVGRNAYRVGVENGLSGIRKRDEVFMRLRYSF